MRAAPRRAVLVRARAREPAAALGPRHLRARARSPSSTPSRDAAARRGGERAGGAAHDLVVGRRLVRAGPPARQRRAHAPQPRRPRAHRLRLRARRASAAAASCSTCASPGCSGASSTRSLTGFWEEEDRTSFDYNRKGGIVQTGRTLDSRTSLILRYLYQDTNVFNIEVPIDEIDRQYRTYTVSGPSASVVFDTRDDPLEPRRGIFLGADLQLSLEALGGVSYLRRASSRRRACSRLRSDLVFVLSARLGLAAHLRRRGAAPAAARALLRRRRLRPARLPGRQRRARRSWARTGQLYPTGGNAVAARRRGAALQLHAAPSSSRASSTSATSILETRDLALSRAALERGPRPALPHARSARCGSTGATSSTRSRGRGALPLQLLDRLCVLASGPALSLVRRLAAAGARPRARQRPPPAPPGVRDRSSASSRWSTAGRCCSSRRARPASACAASSRRRRSRRAIDERLMHARGRRGCRRRRCSREEEERALAAAPRAAARACARTVSERRPAAAAAAPDRDPEVRRVPLPAPGARERRGGARGLGVEQAGRLRGRLAARTSQEALSASGSSAARSTSGSRPGCASCARRADVRYVGGAPAAAP